MYDIAYIMLLISWALCPNLENEQFLGQSIFADGGFFVVISRLFNKLEHGLIGVFVFPKLLAIFENNLN